jgi:large-conductance mechanosensitive channel
MAHKDFCAEHEELKICARSVITWPKFITILLSIIVIAIGVTTTVTASLSRATEKVEEASINRDSEITKAMKTMTDKLEPMGKNITAICTRLGINER